MLKYLHISNLAIIDNLTVDFSAGFNVLTGETGAGKSIMIKALQLVVGGKINASYVGNDADSAMVSAQFIVNPSHCSLAMLKQLGVPVSLSGEIIIRRVFSRRARSQSWINDTIVTSGTLRRIGVSLLDIFGQQDSSQLLDPTHHGKLLDNFVSTEVTTKYSEAFQSYHSIIQQLNKLIREFNTLSDEKDYLEYRYHELQEFEPDEADYAEIISKSKKIRDASRAKESVSLIASLLNGPNGLLGKLESLEGAMPSISPLVPELKEDITKFEEIKSVFEDISYKVENWFSRVSTELAEEVSVGSRISKYQEIFRKTGTTSVKELLDYKSSLSSDLAKLEALRDGIAEAIGCVPRAVEDVICTAEALKSGRLAAAEKISKKVAAELSDLAMKDARISIRFTPVRSNLDIEKAGLTREQLSICAEAESKTSGLSSNGGERPNIFLSANLGEDVKPLEKVASGGEISRIMLALKKVLSSGAEACLLVFDEIDAGISGEVADKVGAKLKELSSSFQIICISHLAQVASYGDRHFKVEKKRVGSRTLASIRSLNEAQSTNEIARLMSAGSLTKASKDHAKLLKAKANKNSSKIFL